MAHEALSGSKGIEAKTGVKLRFLAAIWRHSDAEWIADEIDRLKSIAKNPYVVGVDFMGHETNPTRDFVPHIKQLAAWAIEHDPHFTIRIHAGENPIFAAPNVGEHDHNNVKEALQAAVDARTELAAKKGVTVSSLPMPRIRIGHGLYGADEETIALFKEIGAIVEFNMSSNLALNNVYDIKEIPVARYVNAKVAIVLGTDGLGIYSTTPANEALLARQAGLTAQGFEQLRTTEITHIERDRIRFDNKHAAFEAALAQYGAAQDREKAWQKIFDTVYETPGGHPRMTKDIGEQIAATRRRQIEEMREAIAKMGVETDPIKISTAIGARVPIMLTSASKYSWYKVSPEQQREIQIAMKMIAEHIDPSKAMLVTGGADFGGERELHRAVANRNKSLPPGQKLLLLGTFTTEANAEEIKPGTVTNATIMEFPGGRLATRWFDLPDTTLTMIEERRGIIVAAGGGVIVRDMIQRAHNMKLEMILMNGPEGASTEKSIQLASYGYGAKGAAGVLKALYDKNPNLFPGDFDVNRLQEYRASAESAVQRIHVSEGEVRKLLDAHKGNAKPNPLGYRFLIRIPRVNINGYSPACHVDINGNPVGIHDIKEGKVIFRNPKDSINNAYLWQRLDVDGSGVLVLPMENEVMAKNMMLKLAPILEKIKAAHQGSAIFSAADLDDLLKGSYDAYVGAGRTPDMYNNNTTWVTQKMQPVANTTDTKNGVGLYRKKETSLDLVVLIGHPGEVLAFSGTSKFIDGIEQFGQGIVVLIREDGEIRRMSPAHAEQHYIGADGKPFKAADLPSYEARTLKVRSGHPCVIQTITASERVGSRVGWQKVIGTVGSASENGNNVHYR